MPKTIGWLNWCIFRNHFLVDSCPNLEHYRLKIGWFLNNFFFVKFGNFFKKLNILSFYLWNFSNFLFSFSIALAQGRLTFIVKEETLHWSEVFAKIQSLQKEHKQFVTDITVNETSLEDIFLQFANANNKQQQQEQKPSTEPNNTIETLAV